VYEGLPGDKIELTEFRLICSKRDVVITNSFSAWGSSSE
jgi:hypothetical protein